MQQVLPVIAVTVTTDPMASESLRLGQWSGSRVKGLPAQCDSLSSIPGFTWSEERTDFNTDLPKHV